MEAVKGSPIFFGHRAWGSLAKFVLILVLIAALYVWLWFFHNPVMEYHIAIHGYVFKVEYVFWIIWAVLFLIMIYKHYRWTYLITTREIYVRHGVISADTRTYLYDQVQEASSYQTVGQRIMLWGTLNVTMLISYTGQSKVEEAHLSYMHRPKHIADAMMSQVRIGQGL